jgi:hypothetical protein
MKRYMATFKREAHAFSITAMTKHFDAPSIQNARQQVETYLARHKGVWFSRERTSDSPLAVPTPCEVFFPRDTITQITIEGV